ncbi:MAG TPA: hypothetical protein VLL82_13535 [Mycobacterium sp.]|nr:hypothetical protein [Mycobacterium sp.]
MIQFSEILADAYVSPARNVAMPSMPGRQVKFLQGHAAIKDGRDLAAMLRRTDVKLVLTDYSLSWIEEIEKAAGEVRADVRRPAKAEEVVPDREETSAFEIPPPRKPNPTWDPSWPRDPKTGRMLKKDALAADSTEPGT